MIKNNIMCGNEKKEKQTNKQNSSRRCCVRQKTQTIAYNQRGMQAKMFAQTFYDLFAIKENRDNCLEVPQSQDEECKSTEKLASQNLH